MLANLSRLCTVLFHGENKQMNDFDEKNDNLGNELCLCSGISSARNCASQLNKRTFRNSTYMVHLLHLHPCTWYTSYTSTPVQRVSKTRGSVASCTADSLTVMEWTSARRRKTRPLVYSDRGRTAFAATRHVPWALNTPEMCLRLELGHKHMFWPRERV